MKMQAIKQQVYKLTNTSSTKELRKERHDLTHGRDLRYKAQWLEILEQLKLLRQDSSDISLDDLNKSEAMLKRSLLRVGRLSGLSDKDIEMDWKRIQLEAQLDNDIHIEEL